MTEARSFLTGRFLFFRLLGLAVFFAFASLGAQILGLAGADGILPAADFLDAVTRSDPSSDRFFRLPTLFWLGASDGALSVACWAGAFSGLLLFAGVLHRPAIVAAWALYLSIASVGRSFLAFQWDILLLEVLVASLLIAPRGLFPALGRSDPPARLGLVVLRLILFKLMFSSGFVKLSSGDEAWRDLSALSYHYQTQPLPNPVSWYVHQLPPAFHETSVLLTFGVQLILPVGLFLWRPFRIAALAGLAAHQALIVLTGNYCFFNLIAFALIALSFDDRTLARLEPMLARLPARERWPALPLRARRAVMITAGGLLFATNVLILERTILGEVIPEALEAPLDAIRPFRSASNYGLFAVMTTVRNEIVIEGSEDGATWRSYELPYKPGALDRTPAQVAPLQPRLDWQLWFAALGSARQNPWFGMVLVRLLEGSDDVLGLFESNPFPGRPPRRIRARLYRYDFTTRAERSASGHIWKRTLVGDYVPAFALEDLTSL